MNRMQFTSHGLLATLKMWVHKIFIAYFHPNASDPERQSDLTFAVFNSHAILDALREKYRFDRLRTKIRGNQFDNPNRGRINTLLGDHFGYEIEEEGEGGSDEPVT